jgi:hypothetical protein
MKTKYSRSNPRNDPPSRLRIILILGVVSLASVGIYIITSAVIFRVGFPLDDSWIHQTFARNLALGKGWAFFPGVPSNASTSPLWSALLSVGYWMKSMPYAWSYFLGLISLWGLAAMAEFTIRKISNEYHPRFPWLGAILVFEWHLVWASSSGMETILFILVVTMVLCKILSGSESFLSLGILTGISVWIRPEGITLLGPICFALFFSDGSWTKIARGLFHVMIGFGVIFAFYLFFNLTLSGSPLPNTFYAKQAEFASVAQTPFLVRFASEALQPCIGIGLISLPGVVIAARHQWKQGITRFIGTILWVTGFLAIFAWKLPVTYQYGRYVMPVIPIVILIGFWGFQSIQYDYSLKKRWMIMTFWKVISIAVLAVFWVLGGTAFGKDVAYIESEMVATARWVSANLPPESIIATHDIGALGYFGNHELVDLAGLVSPEIIPIIHDADQISEYLTSEGVDYLVTFPDWYPELTSNLTPVFTTNAPFAPKIGGTNMVVYEWANSSNP